MASSKPLVLLTGGNGFVGAHVLDHLLSANYQVRSTVRSLEKAQFIEKKYANRKDDSSFIIVPDIQAIGALDEAVKNCHEVHADKGIAGLNTSLLRLLTGVTGKDPAFGGKVSTFSLPAWVDVRNVADAHVAALSLPEGTSERFLLCGGVENFEDGLAGLRARGETGLGEEGAEVDRSKHFLLDRTKAEEMLKIDFIPFQQTVEDVRARAKELKLV